MEKKIQSEPDDISNVLNAQGLVLVSEISDSYTLRMGERDERKVIGAELRRKRRALQWTQEELAVRAGTVRETIMRVERGDPSVKPVTLDDVRHAFDAAAAVPDINVRLPGARKPRAEKDFAAVHAELARVSREYRRLRADVYRTGTAIFKIIEQYNLEPPALPTKHHRKAGR